MQEKKNQEENRSLFFLFSRLIALFVLPPYSFLFPPVSLSYFLYLDSYSLDSRFLLS